MSGVDAHSDRTAVYFERTSSQDDIRIVDHIFVLDRSLSTFFIFTLPLNVDRKGLGFSKENYS